VRTTSKDAFRQGQVAQLAARKLMSNDAWEMHKLEQLDHATPVRRKQLESQFRWAEKQFARREAAIDQAMARELAEARESGRPISEKEARIAAENRMYEKQLLKVSELHKQYEQATGRQKEQLGQRLRDAQSEALYYAQEPYYTDAAIEHVVMTLQAAKRKITVKSLLKTELPKEVSHLTPVQGRQSYIEQVAKMYHEISGSGDSAKLASKGAKYFLRALDAVRVAGVDLTPYRRFVEATVDIEAVRADVGKVKAALKTHYRSGGGDAYLRQLREMAAELLRQANNLQHAPRPVKQSMILEFPSHVGLPLQACA